MRYFNFRLTAIAISVLVAAFIRSAIAADDLCRPLDQNSIKEMVEILSHEVLGGRGTTQPGFDVAGLILARELRNAGFQPLPTLNGSYFQKFQFQPHYEASSPFTSRNVIGYIPGSTAADEYILIGAHYDHLGIKMHQGREKVMHPGADDNASGVSAVLEIARALAAMKNSGKAFTRSIIVAFWGAEEFGSQGSRHFVETRDVPLDKIVLVINLDMVGRNPPTRLAAFGPDISKTERGWKYDLKNPRLKEILNEANMLLSAPFTLDFADSHGILFQSDTESFLLAPPQSPPRRIPVLFFFSGWHADYHKPTDTAEKMDFEKINRVACLALSVLHRLAVSDIRVEYTSAAPEQ